MLGLVALAALGGGAWEGHRWWTEGRFMVETDDAYVQADIALIPSRVQGYVAAVPARLNDGDARIALRTAESRVATAGDTLARIDAQVEAARAAVSQAEAARDAAKAQLRAATAAANRTGALAETNVAAQPQLDIANRIVGASTSPRTTPGRLALPVRGHRERRTAVVTEPEPGWLTAWRARGVGTADALSRFDALPSIEPGEAIGHWRGASLPTGHPLDGLLEALGWHGKAFEGPDQVHPLLFRRPSGGVAPLEPGLMPVAVALRCPSLARSWPVRAAFAALLPVLRTQRHAAKLRSRDFRGKCSAAIIYTNQPIVDHLRRVDASRIVGLMERKGMTRPFLFLLMRDVDGRPSAAAWGCLRGASFRGGLQGPTPTPRQDP